MSEIPTPISADRLFRAALEPGLGAIYAATDLDTSPDGTQMLLTGEVRFDLGAPASTKVFLCDLGSGHLAPLTGGERASERSARFSPSGDRIGLLSDRGTPGVYGPWVMTPGDAGSSRQLALPGLSAEALQWCQDSRHLVILAAEEGADQGVASGSGPVQSSALDGERAPWEPTVHRGGATLTGWRVALLVDADTGEHRRIAEPGLNVWEGWVAGDALLAVVSTLPWEGAWTNSWLELIALDGSWRRTVHRPQAQLGKPASSPDGSWLAVIEGLASDRGLVAGQVIVVDRDSGATRRLDTGGVDATSARFRDQNLVVVSGVRGTETVVMECDLRDGAIEVHHQGLLTASGLLYPEAAPHPQGGAIFGAESWSDPPHLAHVRSGRLTEVATFTDDGQRWLGGQVGRLEATTWISSDGLEMSGFLVLPKIGEAPHPTVLAVHGGPAYCWRASWPAPNLLLVALLSARGYAVFLPNPRGSSGRGQEFLAMEIGDYGGAEVEDHLSGLDHLVELGLADKDRLGVYGGSHGGYMSCWLTTRTARFKAAVAVSPVTDWYSQHFGSNIPEFDEMYLRGNPLMPGGMYYERSPVFFAHRSRTPTLLVAGMVDRCTPPGQAVEFHQALLAAGVETELVLYPKEGHGVRSIAAKIDLAERTIDFLDRHLRLP
ncbi:MAG: S9 family peptidase [Candidatus Dormibacteria bacterium]